MNHSDKDLLEKLLKDHEFLEFFQEIADEYSYFEIINKQYNENVHSSFLAWLLTPNLPNNKEHGFKDLFLRRFLNRIQKDNSFTEMDFSDVEVRTESSPRTSADNKIRYDIVLLSKHNRLAIIIENKVYSKEGDLQLDNYFKIAQKLFPPNYTIFYIFLSPGGIPASDEKWLSISYFDIAKIIENLLKSTNRNKFTPFIEQYLLTLRYNIMRDPEIDEIWKIIYTKHKEAIQLIQKYRQQIFVAIKEILKKLIQQNDFVSYKERKKGEKACYVKFTSNNFQRSTINKKLAKILIFEFRVDSNDHIPDGIELVLNICPTKDKLLRKQLYEIAITHPNLFINHDSFYSENSKPMDYVAIYRNVLFRLENYSNMHELKELLVTKFNAFIENDYKKITNIFIENCSN